MDNIIKTIYTNIDQLDFTINGKLKVGVISKLEQAKIEAGQNDNKKAPFEFGNLRGIVNNNGAKGGWSYILTNSTETYTIKEKGEWSVKISIRSVLLASLGYKHSLADVIGRIKEIITPTDYRVGRVDIATDIQAGNWIPNPDLIVKRGQLTQCDIYDDDGVKVGTKDISKIYRKSKIETITVGKVNNFQMQVYNKTRQVNQTPKAEYWRNVWAKNTQYDEEFPVWRFEFRFGRDYFKKRNIYDFADFEQKIEGIMHKVVNGVYILERGVSNIARDGIKSEIWQVVSKNVINYSSFLKSEQYKTMDLKKQLNCIKVRRQDGLEKSIAGFATGIMALAGEKDFTQEELEEKVIDELSELFNNPERYKRCLKDFERKKEEFEYLEYGII